MCDFLKRCDADFGMADYSVRTALEIDLEEFVECESFASETFGEEEFIECESFESGVDLEEVAELTRVELESGASDRETDLAEKIDEEVYDVGEVVREVWSSQ